MPTSSVVRYEPVAEAPPPRPRAPISAGLPSGPGPHWIDARALCQFVVQAVAERARRQRVRIDLSLCTDAASVIGHVDRLYAVVFHLVANALEAMPQGGVIALRVQRASTVTIECADNGPGISADHAPHLWDECDRMKAGGLPATRAIVEAHRGRIVYRPQPDCGASFVVELPAAGPRRLSR
jgi:two-component system sensor histidine kinase FlrB